MTAVTFLLMLTGNGQTPSDFEIRTLAGEPVAGEVRAVAADGSLTVGDKTIAAGEW